MNRKVEQTAERYTMPKSVGLVLALALIVTLGSIPALGQEKVENFPRQKDSETNQTAEDTTLSTFDLHIAYDIEPPSRKGFVYGGGMGIPVSYWSSDYPGRIFNEIGIGPGLDFFAGYGLDDHNIVGVELNFGFYSSEIFDLKLGRLFVGPAWQHYFSPPGKSFFSVIGIGKYDFLPVENYCWSEGVQGDPWILFTCSKYVSGTPRPPTHARGFGYLAGCGYEFSKGYRISGYTTIAQTFDHDFGKEQRFVNADFLIFLGRFIY